MTPKSGYNNVPPLLTGAERWLYRFCGTGSVSGVSGPSVSVQELLETTNDLRETRSDLLAALKETRDTMIWLSQPEYKGHFDELCIQHGCSPGCQRLTALKSRVLTAIAKAEKPITS